jgi:hypothetical protein
MTYDFELYEELAKLEEKVRVLEKAVANLVVNETNRQAQIALEEFKKQKAKDLNNLDIF